MKLETRGNKVPAGVATAMHNQVISTALRLTRKSGEISIFPFKFLFHPKSQFGSVGDSIVRLLFLLLFSCSMHPWHTARSNRFQLKYPEVTSVSLGQAPDLGEVGGVAFLRGRKGRFLSDSGYQQISQCVSFAPEMDS